MIMGCVGLTLNVISVIFLHGMSCWHVKQLNQADCSQNTTITRLHMAILMTLLLVMPVRTICCRKLVTHYSRFTNSTDKEQSTNPHAEHRHKVDISKSKGHSHDLGMMAVLMHIAGDALNNIGVIIAAAVIWKAKYEGRFYADPAVGMGIAIMITLSGLPIGNSLFLFAQERSLNPHNSQEKWPNPPREHAPRRQPRRRKTRPRKSASLSHPKNSTNKLTTPRSAAPSPSTNCTSGDSHSTKRSPPPTSSQPTTRSRTGWSALSSSTNVCTPTASIPRLCNRNLCLRLKRRDSRSRRRRSDDRMVGVRLSVGRCVRG